MRRLVIAVALFAAAAAQATTFHVTNLDDSAVGSLRWAVDQANHSGGADQIVFDVAGTIHSASPIQTTEQVFIDAGGAITLEAAGASPAALILNGILARVRGMAVSNTGGAGIILRGDGDWVESCRVGPNSGDGVRIEGTNGSVTGTTIVDSQNGVVVEDTFNASIFGSFIGWDPDTRTARGNRGDGIHVDAQSDTVYIGGVRTTCTNNCAGFVKPQNLVANSGGVGMRIEGTSVHVLWNQLLDNAGDGIVHAATASGEYIDNWFARNGGNGLTILGRVDNVLANTGACNKLLLLDYGGDGLSERDADALQGAPNHPVLTEASRNVATTTVSGTFEAFPRTSYVVAFHPQLKEDCPDEDQPFDWNPDTITVTTDDSGHGTFTTIVPSHDETAMIATVTAVNGKKMSEPSPMIDVVLTLLRNADVEISTTVTEQAGPILTFTTRVTNHGPAPASDVVVTFTPPQLPSSAPSDFVGNVAPLGNIAVGATVIVRQSFLWRIGTGPVRYEARVTHDGGLDTVPSNDVAVVEYPPRRRAVR